MKLLILFATMVILTVSGCATVVPFLQQGAEEARQAADVSLRSGMHLYCDGASYGAVMRSMTIEEQRRRWKACWPDLPFPPDTTNL